MWNTRNIFLYDMLVSNEYAFKLIDAFFYGSTNFDMEHKNSRPIP